MITSEDRDIIVAGRLSSARLIESTGMVLREVPWMSSSVHCAK